MKLLHIVGARPQFIKLAPLCRAIKGYIESEGSDTSSSVIVHTGQHYDYLMSKVFFDDLRIPAPDYNLEVGSGRHGQQTGLMLARIEEVLLKEDPDLVIVYGDTNSTLAGALAASKLHIPIAHIEAGLRSYNRQMPEEINRVLTDHISTILFCPTKTAVINLQREGFHYILNYGKLIEDSPVFADNRFPMVANVGDLMYDSVLFSFQKALKKSNILKSLNLQTPDNNLIPYALCTIHRQENTDDQQRLKSIMDTLDEITGNGLEVIFPAHPRTQKKLDTLSACFSHLRIIQPVSYYDMLLLQKYSKIILTDSGGVQKEAFFLGVPCITLRDETEWKETVEAGMNIVTGVDKDKVLRESCKFLQNYYCQRNNMTGSEPFGNGHSSDLILKTILNFFQARLND